MANESRLVSREIYNTGGGCMVYFVDLIVDGIDCQVGINEESIVGYGKRFQDIDGDLDEHILWSTDSWQDLIDYIGKPLAVDVFMDFHKHWKYTDCLKDSVAVGGFLKVVEFVTSACKLSDAISKDHSLLDGYSLDIDFEELVIDLFSWQQALINKYSK